MRVVTIRAAKTRLSRLVDAASSGEEISITRDGKPVARSVAEAERKLGILEATRCVLSYFKARMFPIKDPRSFEDWVTNQFGSRLFNIFFKTYTEKVWGMSCKEISADWAAQRIKGLSLKTAIWNALFAGKPKSRGQVIKTLIDSFQYPRLGPGQMWEAARDKIAAAGGSVHMDRRVVRVEHDGSAVSAFVARDRHGRLTRYHGRHFLSTLPIRHSRDGVK